MKSFPVAGSDLGKATGPYSCQGQLFKQLRASQKILDRVVSWLKLVPFSARQHQHIKGKENKVVDALSRNARLNFATAISTYVSDLDE